MRGANDLNPLRGGKFVSREDVANLVVENLGGGAGQGAESIVAQHRKIVGQRHAGEFDAVDNFHGGKGVNMHARHGFLYGAENVAVESLLAERMWRIWSSRISAAVPGRVPRFST